MRTLPQILASQIKLMHTPLNQHDTLEPDFDQDDYDLDTQVYCEFMDESEAA